MATNSNNKKPKSKTHLSKYRFRLVMHPAIQLKRAISSLSDHDFNRTETGLFEVGPKTGLEITARGLRTDVTGYLLLKATGLIEFECRKPLKDKVVDLNCISKKLDGVADQDTVTIYLLNRSDHICFVFGSSPAIEFAVELQKADNGCKKFPDIIAYACEAVVLSEHLRFITSTVAESRRPEYETVLVEMAEERVSMYVEDNELITEYDTEKGIRARGMAPGKMHAAWFKLPHYKALEKASYLDVGLLLCLAMNPRNTIMLRFNLRELGDLVFIHDPFMIFANTNMVRLGL